MRIRISPNCSTSESFVRSLVRPFFFDRGGKILREGRNTIKLFEACGQLYVVKRYGHLSYINRLVYGFLRKSKAERAYCHAQRLRRLGIDTPGEIAFLEIRRHGLLQRSYFVSEFSDYKSLCPIMEMDPQCDKAAPILEGLAGFLLRMHEAGVLHKDLNIGNILYREDGCGEYRFQVIDTNRMQFCRRLSLRKRLDNLRRLSCPAPAYLRILECYARLSHINTDSVQLQGAVMRLVFEMRQRSKHDLKTFLKRRLHFGSRH